MLSDPATKYQLLLRLNNSIINQHTPEGLFTCLAREISHLFRYDRFSINIYDEKTNLISYFATPDGIKPTGIGRRVRPIEKGSIAQLVITSRKPVFLYDLAQHQHLETAKWLLKAGLRSSLAYPMIVREKVLGSIHFSFMTTPPNIFELRDFLNELSVQVAIAVDNMISYSRLRNHSEDLERQKSFLLDNSEDSYQYRAGTFIYENNTMSHLMKEIELAAATDASVLITGETGTGKGHLARYIHNLSPRRGHLFVSVNCAALSPGLIESELFGHAKGAFTGAYQQRTGRFELADKGTILLDEISELPANIQAKLLQVLQDKTFEPVGESTPRSADFRIISASNQNLLQRVHEQTFRPDLFYRLNTFHFHIPPLRERRDDIPLLVSSFTRRHAERLRKPEVRYTSSAMESLSLYPWPGNVRELENLVERLVILHSGKSITPAEITPLLQNASEKPSAPLMTRSEMERRHIEEALARCSGVVGGEHGAARLLGMRRSTLQYRMKKLGISLRPVPHQNR